MATETIKWIPVAEQLPDSDITVLIFHADWDGDPVWIGYFDGEGWKGVDHYPGAAPTHWAEMPEGPQK